MPRYQVTFSRPPSPNELSICVWDENPKQAQDKAARQLVEFWKTPRRSFKIDVELLMEDPKLYDVICFHQLVGLLGAERIEHGLSEGLATLKVIEWATSFGLDSGMIVRMIPSRFRYTDVGPEVLQGKTLNGPDKPSDEELELLDTWEQGQAEQEAKGETQSSEG